MFQLKCRSNTHEKQLHAMGSLIRQWWSLGTRPASCSSISGHRVGLVASGLCAAFRYASIYAKYRSHKQKPL
jgi:hypothetical protein